MKNIAFFVGMFLSNFLLGQEVVHLDSIFLIPSERPVQGENMGLPITGLSDTIYRDYVPYGYDIPIVLDVNLVFIQKDNGTGNFQEENAEHRRFWDSVEVAVNKRYMKLGTTQRDSCFAWRDPFIDDAKIRFKFHRIYIRDSEMWDWSNYGSDPDDQIASLKQLREEIERDSSMGGTTSCVF